MLDDEGLARAQREARGLARLRLEEPLALPQLPTMDLTAMKLAVVEGPTERGGDPGYTVTSLWGASMGPTNG